MVLRSTALPMGNCFKKIFDDIWIQPAGGDAGSARVLHLLDGINISGEVNTNDSMKGTTGSYWNNRDITKYLKQINAPFHTHSDPDLFEHLAEELQQGHVIGWFNGPMDFGPRALGGVPSWGSRNQKMQSVMNLKIKYREISSLCPIGLEEDVSNQFEMNTKNHIC